MASRLDTLPQSFIWRRIHSLSGLWLVIFLIEHLITNSQAALLFGDSGKGFIRMVNWLHNLPYLHFIEVTLLGVPILLHMIWGIKYAITSKFNSEKTDGSKPYLKYNRNKAYTWQRITSWILVVLLTLHIVKFRFLEYPHSINAGSSKPTYFVKVSMDPGLYTVAQRLNVELIDSSKQKSLERESWQPSEKEADEIREEDSDDYDAKDANILEDAQCVEERERYIDAIAGVRLKRGEVIATSTSFGTASLLTVRDTFKSPFWVAVYTLFVLSACFHAFNGLWTSMLTWGWIIKTAAQTNARKIAIGLMIIIAFLGLAAVWGTYFFNLKH